MAKAFLRTTELQSERGIGTLPVSTSSLISPPLSATAHMKPKKNRGKNVV